MTVTEHIPPLLKPLAETSTWLILAGVVMNYLPVIAVLAGLSWHLYQMYDLYDRRKNRENDR